MPLVLSSCAKLRCLYFALYKRETCCQFNEDLYLGYFFKGRI